MKKILSLIFVVALSASTFGQTNEMTFIGIPMDQTKENFIDALKKKGFNDGVKQEKWDFQDKGCITLKGNFWEFKDCSITIRYAISNDSVVSVLVHKQNYSIYQDDVHRLMESLDMKYGNRHKVRQDYYAGTEYRWFSIENGGMVSVGWHTVKEASWDDFYVEYFTSVETKKIIEKEARDKIKELNDL